MAAPPPGYRVPTAVELGERFDWGVLAVASPEPVEGPWLNIALVGIGERPSLDTFAWTFWVGTDLHSVRIEMCSRPSFGAPDAGYFTRILESWGHQGQAIQIELPVVIDGVPVTFHGTRLGEGVAVRNVLAGIAVELYFMDGWPHDQELRLERRGGQDFDAMGLTTRNYWPPWEGTQPPDIILRRAGHPPETD